MSLTRAERIAGELSEEDRRVIARLPADGSMRIYKPGSKGTAVRLAKRFDFEVVAFTTGYGMIYLTKLGREVRSIIEP